MFFVCNDSSIYGGLTDAIRKNIMKNDSMVVIWFQIIFRALLERFFFNLFILKSINFSQSPPKLGKKSFHDFAQKKKKSGTDAFANHVNISTLIFFFLLLVFKNNYMTLFAVHTFHWSKKSNQTNHPIRQYPAEKVRPQTYPLKQE